jgi:hypothetical protein
MSRISAFTAIALCGAFAASGHPIQRITIDGDFADWSLVSSHSTPASNTHDTDHDGPNDVPSLVEHVDADLLEYKFTHDEENFYAFFRSRGIIGRTQSSAQGTAGRYYVITTIDVDNDESTGYPLHEGGYYPTSGGYDMNFEIEFYDGAFNTGHYLNHGCLNQAELDAAFIDQANGIVRVLPGTYEFYSQWVYWDEPQGFLDEIVLPNGASVVWVVDKGPVYQGIVQVALSDDGHRAEVIAPFRGFMNDPQGSPIIALGKTIKVSMSLEASGELAEDGEWASDTGPPIANYILGREEADFDSDGFSDDFERNHESGPNDATSTPAPSGVAGDVDISTNTDAVDVQLVINGALSVPTPMPTDLSGDSQTDAVDVQLVINAALGL